MSNLKTKGSRKTLTLIFLTLISIFLLSGCNNNGSNDVDTSELPTIAFYAYDSEPVLDWDPSVGTSNEIIIYHNVYETLTRFNSETGDIEPLIAESYKVSEDGMEWVFNIRKDMKFHDGTDVNAEAVKFSIDRTMERNMGAAYIWGAVQEIIVVDEYSVKFILMYPSPIDIISSSSYGAFIMSPDAVTNNDEEWFSQGNEAGSGPYIVDSAKMGEEVVLKKFDEYWGGWNEQFYDKVIIRKVSEVSSRRQLVESGEAQITTYLPAEDIEAMRKKDNITIITSDSFTNAAIHLNTEVEPLNDVRVRQALSYAFPYEDVIKYAAGNYGVQSKGVIPAGIIGYSEDLPQYKFDLDKAQVLLDEAGISEDGFTLSYNYSSGDEIQKKTGELYKAELKKLNIELEIRGMPWDSYFEMAKATNPEDRQDMFAMNWWPENALPSSWFYNLYHSQDEIYWNLSYWSDPIFDELTDAADELSTSDRELAEEKYIEANKLVIEEAPSIFIYDSIKVYATSKEFKGLKANPAYEGVIFFNECYPEN